MNMNELSGMILTSGVSSGSLVRKLSMYETESRWRSILRNKASESPPASFDVPSWTVLQSAKFSLDCCGVFTLLKAMRVVGEDSCSWWIARLRSDTGNSAVIGFRSMSGISRTSMECVDAQSSTREFRSTR